MALFPTTPQDGAPDEAVGSETDEGGLFGQIQDWVKADRGHWRDFWNEAEQMFDIVAGRQWDDDDLAKLAEDLRPAVTFNRTGPFIDGVSGLEISNRQEARYIPRQLGVAGVNDLLTGAEKWARDGCDAEDEESEAFRDTLICGMGWTQTRMCYDEDPDGMILVEKIDPMEMLLDRNSSKANGADARRVTRIRTMPIEAAREMAPDADDDDLDATWARDITEEADDPHNAREAPFYRNDQSGRGDDPSEKHEVTMVEIEWYDMEVSHRVADPTSGKPVRLTGEQHTMLQSHAKAAGLQPIRSVKDHQRKYKRALVGNKVLLETDGPDQGGFSYKCITGKRDRRKGCWYGMVRPMKDPQEWANKWMSQVLFIMNSNAKGGIYAEEDAFANPNEAEDTWSDPAAITMLAPGGLNKMKEKPALTFPQGLMQLMEFAVQAIPGVTGFSPEMMGMVDRDQSGVLEQGRKQQGMILLAPFFNSLRRYRKQQGRLMLWMIQTFISDGRLIRIGGADNAQFVPLVRDKLLGEYDVVVDDTPTSPNIKEQVWGTLTQMFPIFQSLHLPPQVYLEFLKYSPLPATLVQKLNQMAEQAAADAKAKGGQPDPHTQALVAKETAAANLDNAKAQSEPLKAQLQAEQVRADIENKRANAAAALQKAGLAVNQQNMDLMNSALQGLLDTHAAALAGQDQGHAHDLAWAQHQQADAQQQQGAAQFDQSHALATQQAAQPQGAAE